ncbi:MAG: ferredoxin, partial [Candidatus Latescibacteria bacterium]|nr:ferredoxin [Candidatus Latescibacterota bacterium]
MPKLTLNDQEIVFIQGETLLDIATRYDIDIPTLCHDPRLKPA